MRRTFFAYLFGIVSGSRPVYASQSSMASAYLSCRPGPSVQDTFLPSQEYFERVSKDGFDCDTVPINKITRQWVPKNHNSDLSQIQPAKDNNEEELRNGISTSLPKKSTGTHSSFLFRNAPCRGKRESTFQESNNKNHNSISKFTHNLAGMKTEWTGQITCKN